MTTLDRAEVVLGANDRELRTALGRAQSSMQSAGRRLGRIAKRAAQAITAALGAAGAAAVKFSADFEREMTKVNTLVGISQERVQAMNDEVLRMAADVGRAPTELARGLFRLTSGGERGADVLESLGTAGRAAAIGMGETGNLTRIATSAAQAFQGEGSSVSDVLNTMTKVVREGNVQVNRLQNSLGQVQATAADAGLSFQAVGGFLATASRVMGDTQKAARGLRQFLARLAKPTPEMSEAFREAGTSVEEFRSRIATEGLARPLIELVQNARASGVEVANLAGSVRAMTPILATAGSQAEEYLKIQRRVHDFQGTISEAFETTSTTLSFMIDQLREAGRVALTRIGQDMFPTMKNFVTFLRDELPGAVEGIVRTVGTVGLKITDFAVGMVRFFEGINAKLAGGLGLIGFLFLGPQGAAVAATLTSIGARIGRNLARIIHGPATEEAVAAQRVLDLVEERNALIERRASLQRKLRDDPPHADALRDELEHVNSELDGVEGRLDIANRTLERTPDAAEEAAIEMGGLVEETRAFFATLQDVDLSNVLGGGGGGSGEDTEDLIPLPFPDQVRQRVIDLQEAMGEIPFQQRVTPFFTGGGPGAIRSRMEEMREQMAGGPGIIGTGMTGITFQQPGEEAGDSFMDGFGRRVQQGAQSAMQALISGLLRGKQNMEETLARIGISIASTLLTQGLFSGLGIASPAKEGIFAGEMMGEGLAVGMENTVRRVRQAASSVAVTAASAAATGRASVATPGAAGSVSARDGVIDASSLDPMGQVAAHVAMESPSLQRLFTAGTDDARKRRGER